MLGPGKYENMIGISKCFEDRGSKPSFESADKGHKRKKVGSGKMNNKSQMH